MGSHLLVFWVLLCSPISCLWFFPLVENSHFVISLLFLPPTLTFSNNSSLQARLRFRPTSLLVVFTIFYIKKWSDFLFRKFLKSLLYSVTFPRGTRSFQAAYYCEALYPGGFQLISYKSHFHLIHLVWWLILVRIPPLLFFLIVIKMLLYGFIPFYILPLSSTSYLLFHGWMSC